MEKVVEMPARCHVLDNLYAWLTSKVKMLTAFMSLNPLGTFSRRLHTCLLPACALINITVDWLLALIHQGGRRVSKATDREGRPF